MSKIFIDEHSLTSSTVNIWNSKCWFQPKWKLSKMTYSDGISDICEEIWKWDTSGQWNGTRVPTKKPITILRKEIAGHGSLHLGYLFAWSWTGDRGRGRLKTGSSFSWPIRDSLLSSSRQLPARKTLPSAPTTDATFQVKTEGNKCLEKYTWLEASWNTACVLGSAALFPVIPSLPVGMKSPQAAGCQWERERTERGFA